MRSIRILSTGILLALLTALPGRAETPNARPGAIVPAAERVQAVEAKPLPKPARQADTAPGDTLPDLKTQIGQMILVGFVGNSIDKLGYERVNAQLQAGEITGVLYLGRNILDRHTVGKMNAGLNAAAPAPPLIAVDQEGGVVQRLKGWHRFPQTVSAKRMAQRASPADAATAYDLMAEALADWGFNLNLGPVVDLDKNPRNPIIGRLGRSFSSDPEIVVAFSEAFIDAHRRHGVFTALKHFPGHGSSHTDSHKGAVDISRTWSPDELEPFRQLIAKDKADLIMTAHVHNRGLQDKGERKPVSLSETALAGVLRGDLGYDGVIITDDLQMDAIRKNHSFRDAVVMAVEAGTDILVFANDKRPDPEVPAKVTDILVKAAESDPALRQKIAAAYKRVRALKSRLKVSPIPKPAPRPSGQTIAEPTADPDQKVLTPEDVDASIRSVRLVLPEGLPL